MGLLRFPEQVGTTDNDILRAGSQTVTFGLSGDDELRATVNSEYNFLAGGAGNDKYYSAQGAAITIFDTGGTDTLFAPRLGITDWYTYAATVENGRHLIAWSSRYGDQIAIANWRDRDNSIEYVSLSDGVFTLSDVIAAVQRSPNYRGDFSIVELSYVDILPTGTTLADVQEFLSYIEEQEEALAKPTPVAPINSTPISDSSSVQSSRIRELTASTGDEVFQGLSDKVDVLRQSSSFSNYSIQKIGTTVVLTDNTGSGGTDTLVGIERVEFSDKAVAFDVDGATSAGGIYRLYKATFNREPDTNGLGYWIGEADLETKDAVRMAEDFTWSEEFQNLYGIQTTDNYGTGNNIRALIEGFYENVLGRTPDEGGLNFYTGVIESKERTVGRVLAEISDSQENYDGTIELIANGIVFDPYLG